MATENNNNDALRNPAVDYDRTDLSPRGILLFFAGLLIAGIFIELVIWGMFRFLSHSQLFAQGRQSPLATVKAVGPENAPGVDLQNMQQANVGVFPQPRLQTDDVQDMRRLLESEHQVLYPAQPFMDTQGNVHISITDAMKLIEQRGLPVKPAGLAAQADTGKAQLTPHGGVPAKIPASSTGAKELPQ